MEFDDNMPIPKSHNGSGSHGKYMFRKMTVGQSFFLPGDDGRKMEGAALVFAHRNKDYGLTTRRVTEGGIRGVRVWRTR